MQNFRDPKSNHESHENIVPRNFGAIRYIVIAHSVTQFKTTSVAVAVVVAHKHYSFEARPNTNYFTAHHDRPSFLSGMGLPCCVSSPVRDILSPVWEAGSLVAGWAAGHGQWVRSTMLSYMYVCTAIVCV